MHALITDWWQSLLVIIFDFGSQVAIIAASTPQVLPFTKYIDSSLLKILAVLSWELLIISLALCKLSVPSISVVSNVYILSKNLSYPNFLKIFPDLCPGTWKDTICSSFNSVNLFNINFSIFHLLTSNF